ncbi:FYVE, RhoGEF and PH domain-containing protein 6 [Toxocara canis]|uniref:FYVE, RhoGEF and PH domain-containing protein 6 n=1 Tax=Toxocara canis TaxID=6265 RepID=A0A0B2UT55_TOXCA|nr:FYVE, RhoGEF and PH domain-containing protein 6 [Toxocara canis]
MHEANETCSSGVSVSQIRARLEGIVFNDKPSPPSAPVNERTSKIVSPLSFESTVPIVNRSSLERPPVAPKPQNKVVDAHKWSISSQRAYGAALDRINRRIAALASSVSTERQDSSSSSNPARRSFVDIERSESDGEAACSKTLTNVRSAAAHFDSLISSGLIGAPGGIAREFDSSASLLSPSESMIQRPASETSWSDIRNEASSISSDAETNSYNDLSDLEDEETLLARDISFNDPDSMRPRKKTSVFGSSQLHASALEELRSRKIFQKDDLRLSERPHMRGKALSNGIPSDVGRLRPQLPKKSREARYQPLTVEDAESVLKMRHKSDAGMVPRPSVFAKRASAVSEISVATTTSTDSHQSEVIVYSTGDPAEDMRLKKLHYAALEIYTVEKKFVEQLDVLAVQYPKFISEYGKARGVSLLADRSNVISLMASQLLMLKEAHSVLLEKFTAKICNWDSRHPNMAEVLKNNAGFLKFCVPYLKEKKKFVDELMKQLQTNELLAQATSKFEEQATNRISIIQRLDIVHQNVVRYTILLEAYKKYLIPDSHEYTECESAIKELSKVSEVVNHQMSLAVMEEKLFELYRRLEGHFNVFEANRHLLHEGELMKQSRKDIQPRYLILFSDVLLICKYSRAPSLGSDVCFQPDFYQFSILGVRVKAEEHGEYETHFQLLSTKKSAVFIAKSKRERDDWVKRLNDAKKEARNLRRISVARCAKLAGTPRAPTSATSTAVSEGIAVEKDTSDNDISPTLVHVSEKYVAPWIPDPKATTCMMAGCNTKFNILNRRHHCRECGALICGNCVGHAPVKCGTNFVREKVCPECFVKITKRCKNKRLGEAQKWGRLIQHSDGAMVLCFYDAEFDAEPCARHVLLGFHLSSTPLDEGGELFELTHTNQVKGNSISISFRVAHARSAEQWNEALTAGLRAFWTGATNNNNVDGEQQSQA